MGNFNSINSLSLSLLLTSVWPDWMPLWYCKFLENARLNRRKKSLVMIWLKTRFGGCLFCYSYLEAVLTVVWSDQLKHTCHCSSVKDLPRQVRKFHSGLYCNYNASGKTLNVKCQFCNCNHTVPDKTHTHKHTQYLETMFKKTVCLCQFNVTRSLLWDRFFFFLFFQWPDSDSPTTNWAT